MVTIFTSFANVVGMLLAVFNIRVTSLKVRWLVETRIALTAIVFDIGCTMVNVRIAEIFYCRKVESCCTIITNCVSVGCTVFNGVWQTNFIRGWSMITIRTSCAIISCVWLAMINWGVALLAISRRSVVCLTMLAYVIIMCITVRNINQTLSE